MERKTIVKQGRRVAWAACALLIGASVMQSCKDDDLILTGQPDWLGNSIYERLQDEGNYKYTLRLIDDLGETEVLSHTGSRTLFVASDDAYDEWFQTNKWGVRSYEDLGLAQKRLLLKNSMINNAYLLELMSNKRAENDGSTPEWGRTMRRQTSTNLFDSIYVMPVSAMPNTSYWEEYKQRGHGMPILRDATEAPMIHFLPAYLENHKITEEDLYLLTNRKATSLNEAWVNGVKVTNSGDASRKKIDYDVTCKNGYIQKVDAVIEASPNMAEIIHSDPNTQLWSQMLDRFSAPFFNKALSDKYNNTFGTRDSLFVLGYLSKNFWKLNSSGSGEKYTADYNGGKYVEDTKGNRIAKEELLLFDPGWNTYEDNNQQNEMTDDAAMMIVPTDDAVNEWWNGNGMELQEEYDSLAGVPVNIIAELLNVNMFSTFSSFVPSKFGSVLNDAKEPLGITKENIVGCYMGCNGVVYKVNKLFTPALFSSVAYPALAHASEMNVIYYAIDSRNFKPYLLSMDSKYALILPNNDALSIYLDPSSYGKSLTDEEGIAHETPDVVEFNYDKTTKLMKASRYAGSVDDDGNIEKTSAKPTQAEMPSNTINKLFDSMMDQLIIVIPDKSMTVEDYIRDGYNYFKTKGGSMVKASFENGNLVFQGGWQLEHNNTIPTTAQYVKDNGKSYIVETQSPMGAQNSVYMTLHKYPEFSGFLGLLENDYVSLTSVKLNNKYNAGLQSVGNKNLRILDNYNYTIYVPTNEAIQKLRDKKIIPTEAELDRSDLYDAKTGNDPVLDSICLAENWYDERTSETEKLAIRKKVATCIGDIVGNLVRYHVQDHSLAVGMAYKAESNDNSFESMLRNPETGRFFPLRVDFDNRSMAVLDAYNKAKKDKGNSFVAHNVVTSNGLYNLICREYWFEGAGNSARLFMANDVVMHQIDGVLMYEDMKPWREVVSEALNK